MPTTMNFALSPTLLSHLTTGGAGNGVFAYAFAFEGANLIPGGAVTLVNNGVAAGAPSVALTTASHTTFSSGKVYIVIQQTGAGGTSDLLATVTHVGDINSIDSATRNYRFDLVEATLSNSASDVADISAINQFGSALTLAVQYQGGLTDTRGYAVSGADDRHGDHRRVAGRHPGPGLPSRHPGNDAAQRAAQRRRARQQLRAQPDPRQRLDRLRQRLQELGEQHRDRLDLQRIAGAAAGRRCRSTGRSTTRARIRSGWFPTTASGGMSTDYINISTQDLINNVYLQTGKLHVYAGSKTGAEHTYDSFTPNNAAGDVAKYFVAGFDAGFWGGTGRSVNPKDASTLNLSETWNWNANYAYNAILNPAVGYSNALGTGRRHADRTEPLLRPLCRGVLQEQQRLRLFLHRPDLGRRRHQPGDQPVGQGHQRQRPDRQHRALRPRRDSRPPASRPATPATWRRPAPTTCRRRRPAPTSSSSPSASASAPSFLAPSKETPISFRFYAPGDAQAGADGFVVLGAGEGRLVLLPAHQERRAVAARCPAIPADRPASSTSRTCR